MTDPHPLGQETFIYALGDPETAEIRYIGRTSISKVKKGVYRD